MATTIGDSFSVPSTTLTLGSDTVYPTSISYEISSDSEYAAHMQDNARVAYLSSTTTTLTCEWIAPERPTVTVNSDVSVTLTAGSDTIVNAVTMRVKSISVSGRARELWKGSITLESVSG